MVMGISSIICVVAICKGCGQGVIFKYLTSSSSITTSGFPILNSKPDIEWCGCGSDEPRYLCKIYEDNTPGFLDKCHSCYFKFSCATSRIEVIYTGYK